MHLAPLFEKQKELDERIIIEHGLEGQDLLPQKILALQVELGELANEWRGFKFWSKDQKPRMFKQVIKDGVDMTLSQWAEQGANPTKVIIKNPLLEEYVDCLHFILSIGNDLGFNETFKPYLSKELDELNMFKLVFLDLSYFIIYEGRMAKEVAYGQLFSRFLALGKVLGFTWEEIKMAYMDKNKVNHERQDNGY
jgi:dimeric dUTPase (all-alpha-NTP-PPase superfamily)